MIELKDICSVNMPADIDAILGELGNDDPEIQDMAVSKLEQLGHMQAVLILVKLLEQTKWRQTKDFDPDKRGPAGERPQGRMIYEPLSYLALRSLERLIPTSPVIAPDQPASDKDVHHWKYWWEENKKSNLKGDIS